MKTPPLSIYGEIYGERTPGFWASQEQKYIDKLERVQTHAKTEAEGKSGGGAKESFQGLNI